MCVVRYLAVPGGRILTGLDGQGRHSLCVVGRASPTKRNRARRWRTICWAPEAAGALNGRSVRQTIRIPRAFSAAGLGFDILLR
jgi:hypothetical protein